MSQKNIHMEEKEKETRIAIVNNERCKPKKCKQECRKFCPVNKSGKLCIEVTPKDQIAVISEVLCIGCGLCMRKCPLKAITVISIPSNLAKETTHRYGANSFKLNRMPSPKVGEVLGLVGTNGIGKSTALKILGGKQKPNLGRYDNPPDWTEVLTYFRGSELQNFFKKVVEDNLKAVMKPQYVDQIIRVIQKGSVKELLESKDDMGNLEDICKQLDLVDLYDRDVTQLSGGELQRFAIAMICVQKADMYMFDEPSSYLDVKQRLKAAQVIRGLVRSERYVVVVEHDLSVLDYLADSVCCLYGVPGAYGVVTMPFGVRKGINIFLDGFIPAENMRFRETPLNFRMAESGKAEDIKSVYKYEYPSLSKQLGKFSLTVEKGNFADSEIIVMLGENGTGKTTFIRMLAGLLEPDSGGSCPSLNVSYKPQKITPKFQGTVQELLHDKIHTAYTDPQFVTDVLKPLLIDNIIDQELQNLSGGEIQRVALTLCLGKEADVYLIDEPSAYLDSEQRIQAAKVIKRFILHANKTAFIVEHDFIMATYLADRVVVFEGSPGMNTTANSPQNLLNGLNKFLASMDITFRRDPKSFRPRINELNGVKDIEQKKAGQFFFLED